MFAGKLIAGLIGFSALGPLGLLIGLYVGQRVSDLLALKPFQLRFIENGVYIDINQQKTDKYVTVGVVDKEVIQILKQSWSQDQIKFKGKYYQLDLTSRPVKPYQQNGGPLLYFGGYSPDGVDLCAEFCDVYLMWPETESKLKGLMDTMTLKASNYNRTVKFGLRVHVIVRETEQEARDYADQLISKLDLEKGTDIRNRAQDAASLGVSRQSKLREESDGKYYVEPNLWTGIGLARSGCGAAIVGSPDQVVAKIERYIEMGINSFIFSGYPHEKECEIFAKLVLPRLKTISLPEVFGRVPNSEPNSPLGYGLRK